MSDTTTTNLDVTTDPKDQVTTPETTIETKPSDKEINFEALRKAKAETDRELKALRDELKAKNEAELKAQGKLQELLDLKTKEAEELKTEREAIRLESQLKDEILKSGVNPKYAKYLQNEVKESVKVSETGEITGISDKIALLKTEYPEWFNPTPITGYGSGQTTGANKSISLDQLSELTPAEYRANREQALKAFSGQKL